MTMSRASRLIVERVSDTQLRMTRSFAAPRVLVFRVFTDASLIPTWWGRTDSMTEVEALDFRPGGGWRFVERSADGNAYAFRGRFLEIDPPGRLVQTFEFEGAPGQIVTEETALTETDGVTIVTTLSSFGSADELQGMVDAGMEIGAGETYDRLEDALPALVAADADSQVIELRRFYRAPRTLVFTAWTTPALLDRWWGPNGYQTETHESDARTGGTWRYTMTGPDGTVFPNMTWYDEVTPPESIVYRHAAAPENEADAFHVTVRFDERDGVTSVHARMVFPSIQACRAVKAFGAVELGYQTHRKLDALLAEIG